MKGNSILLKQELKKMIKLVYLFMLIGLLVFSSCEEEETKFIFLDTISTNPVMLEEYLVGGHYIEYILVSNPPDDYVISDSLIIDYFRKNRMFFCKMNNSIKAYSISFHKKTSCTSYFLNNRQDRRHQIQGDVGCKDQLAMFYYDRSEINPRMWYASYPDDFKDTVYCDCLIPAPSLLYKNMDNSRKKTKEEDYTNQGTKQNPQPCERSYLDIFYYKPISKDSLIWYNGNGDTLYCSQIIE